MDTAALKASWGKVVAAGDDVPLYFYSHLFLSHPEVRSMFPIQMSGQRDKLVTALGAVVSNVDEIDKVIPLLEQLGRDHRRFSVVTEHYTAVGASLLATLKKFLGPSWTPDLADTWAQAYGLVAKVMVAAAEQHEDIAPASWEADVVRVERRSVEVAVVEVTPREPFPYRAGQSVAVEIPQRPRLWRYFSPANAPDASGRMQFHIQPIAGGLVSTAVVRRLSEGDTIRMGAPVGEQLTLSDRRALTRLNDSKQHTAEAREELYPLVMRAAARSVIVSRCVRGIDSRGLHKTNLEALRTALLGVALPGAVCLVDGFNVPEFGFEQRAVIDGDCRSAAIAAASVLAKVSRDRYMRKVAARHPEWDFDTNVGYSTPEHRAAIAQLAQSERRLLADIR